MIPASVSRRFHWVVGTLVACALILAACGAQSRPTAPPRPPLKFGYVLWPGYYPVLIAQGRGYFQQGGVTVDATLADTTDAMMSDFVSGKYDAIAITLGSLVNLIQSHPGLRITAVVDQSAGGDAFIAAPGIQTIGDLRGKAIGVNLGTFGELFVITALTENGLTPGDVTLVDMDAKDVAAKMASGQVVGGHTWEPYVSQALDQDQMVLFSSAQTPGLIPDVIAFRAEALQNRPDDVRAFTRAWFQAAGYWLDHPQEGTKIAADALGVPIESISLKGIKLMTYADNLAAFQPSNSTVSLQYTTQLYIDFYARVGSIRTPPDITQLLDSSFLVAP